MIEVLLVALLACWSAGVGLAILRRLDAVPGHRLDALALALPLGLGAMSLGTLAIGAAGMLNRGGIAGLFLLGLIVIGLDRRRPGLDQAEGSIGKHDGVTGRAHIDVAFGVALACGLIGTFLQALTPVADGDALCYHLQVPKVFLLESGLAFEPDLHETVYPLLVELLDAVALAFAGPVACRLISWVFGLAFAANVAALARPALGRRAWWAGATALLSPAVSNGMGAPLNDVALAACCTATLHALTLWLDRRTLRTAALVGLLGGLAIGVKYPALVWVGLIGLAMLAARGRPSQLATCAALIVLTGGWWYLRAYLHTGNPVFPFFRQVFGAGIDDVLDPIKRPMDVTPWNLLTALVPMTLQPDRFDSWSHQFGPAFLLFLPGLLVLRPPRRVALIVAFGYVFLTLCLSQRQSMRFVLAALGPFSVGVAWVASESRRRGLAGQALTILLALALLAEGGLALARSRRAVGVLTGRESAESYLARIEPTWTVGRWIGAHLPEDARLIGQDHRGFYLPRPYAMELAHRRRTGLASHGESSEQIITTLRQRGFTHLMICPPDPIDAVEFDPTLTEALAPWLGSRAPLYDRAITDGDGVVRRYAIYRLDEADAVASADPGGARR